MEDKILKSFEMIVAGKPEQAYLLNFDYALDALTAMVERRFSVTFMDASASLHAVVVMDTGVEQAIAKAERKLTREIGYIQLIGVEEDFECDDPRFGER